MKSPKNTSLEALLNPLLTFLLTAPAGGIEAQEAQWQRELEQSDTLPTTIGRYDAFDSKAILVDAGVEFLGPVPDDPIFQFVRLPKGWKKRATEHAMWSDLLDEQGRVRAAIFYKAAFYDRRAHMTLLSRFTVRRDYDREDVENKAVAMAFDMATGKAVMTIVSGTLPDDGQEKYEVSKRVVAEVVAWLDAKYPEWKNPGKYWD